MDTKYHLRRIVRLLEETTAELQRLEHRFSDDIPGFDVTDLLTSVRSARDSVIDAQDTILVHVS